MDNQLIRIKDTVMARIDPGRDVPEEEIRQIIDNVLRDYSSEYMLPAKKKLEYRKILFNDIKRLDILQEIIDDDSVTEIMVNGWNKIFIEQDGVIRKWDKKFDEPKRLNDIVQRIASSANKIVNESVPIADTKLADGSRVNIVMNPVAIDGPIITIRKFYNTPLSMEKMIEIGSVSEEAAGFLASLVKARYNIFISGGTGSGKTTYLMEVYGIPASRVIRHYDVTGKLCPGIKGWNLENGSDDKKWQTFKAQLSAEAEDNTPAPAPAPAPSGATTVNYAYKVTVSDLNIRKGPGTNYDSAGYTGKGVFTIVAEKGGWGKLKSGAGWISLNSKYGHKVSSGSTAPAAAPSKLKWTVTISDLRIRKGPGTNYDWTGAYTGKGTFTIVEKKNGWGRLKSGAGWISLNTAYGHKA